MLQLAALFDTENVSAEMVEPILMHLRNKGTASIRLAVGNFSNPGLAPWLTVAPQQGLALILQPSVSKNKNAADIRLVIEAMTLLHRNHVQGFAIINSDSEFTPLALHLRQTGKLVLDYGRTISSAFGVDDHYFTFEDILAPSKLVSSIATFPPKLTAKELSLIRQCLQAAMDSQTGIVHIGQVGQNLRKANALLADKIGKDKLQKTLTAIKLIEIS